MSSTSKAAATRQAVPEGIEGRVAHKGSVAAMVHQLIGGYGRYGYCGSAAIPELQRKAQLIESPRPAGESHVHDVQITRNRPTTGWNRHNSQ